MATKTGEQWVIAVYYLNLSDCKHEHDLLTPDTRPESIDTDNQPHE